jgi:pyridoxal phosphate enzyme (YggS family)
MSADSDRLSQIKKNLEFVRENIYKAAERVGRSPDEVKLLVVTKTHPVEIVRGVIEAGVHDVGENYIEEAQEKIIALKDDAQCSWHMIGHVQSRKSVQVVECFSFVHSLDSVKLARRLNQHAQELNKILPVLLELNLSGEGSKSGWQVGLEGKLETIYPEVDTIVSLSNINVCGLMTMPPYFDDPEDARIYFRRLNHIKGNLQRVFEHIEWKELSMGMSGDYEVAIEEGATWVRIGQAILGQRVA